MTENDRDSAVDVVFEDNLPAVVVYSEAQEKNSIVSNLINSLSEVSAELSKMKTDEKGEFQTKLLRECFDYIIGKSTDPIRINTWTDHLKQQGVVDIRAFVGNFERITND